MLDNGAACHEGVDRVMEVLRNLVAAFRAEGDWRPLLVQEPQVLDALREPS